MKKLSLLSTCFVLLSAINANAICLDYWLEGPAACNNQEEKDKKQIILKGLKNGEVITIEKDAERLKYEEDMNVKIDKFLANYGKPPREFVAFHLDPSLENAVRWVKKFNTDFERTMKVAVAWRQADRLFQEYKKTGELVLPPEVQITEKEKKYLLKAFEEDATDLPEVKGFGVSLPNDLDKDRLSRNYAKLDYKEEDQARAKAVAKLSKTAQGSGFSLKSLQEKLKRDKKQADKVVQYSKGNKQKKSQNASYPLQISYYFSAKCEFCDKFSSELSAAIDKVGKQNVNLTCVDMTPGSGKSPNNIKGKIDCNWRPLTTGEAKQYGVQKTPSLLVKRKNSAELELLEGYHKQKALKKYFENGAN